MIEVAFILLMYVDGEIDKYAYYNGSIGQCLMQKRQVERDYNRYDNVRLACEQYTIESEEVAGVKHITALIEPVLSTKDPLTTNRRRINR